VSPHLELWPIDRITYELPKSKDEVIGALLDLACKGLKLGATKRSRVFEALLARERSGSTAASGLAIPHVKVAEVKAPVSALGIATAGIEFGAVDGERVHAVFLLVSPDSMAAEHTAVLRFIAGVARNPDFMRFLRQTRAPADARGLLEEMGA
jgi:mannitol/fructose-specific phosphotransferase system IIA component (Ntr-type)